MKYCIFGDIHANLEAFYAVLETAQELGVDRYVCLGDIVGYNANPAECVSLVQQLNCEVVIRGNHDEMAGGDMGVFGFNPEAARAILWTRSRLSPEQREWLNSRPMQASLGNRATVVHATLDNPHMWGYVFDRLSASTSISYQFTPVCFYGHTHVPIMFEKFGDVKEGARYTRVELKPGRKYLFNAGSVGQPRDGDPRAAFVTFDPDEKVVELHRVEYDIQVCQKKILDAGLPERLALRLAGRH